MSSDPTPDEARNGWTPETLKKYLADRDDAACRVHRVGRHADDPEPLRFITVHDLHDW